MPRRSLLTAAERSGLLAFPTADDELIRHYTFSEPDLSAYRHEISRKLPPLAEIDHAFTP